MIQGQGGKMLIRKNTKAQNEITRTWEDIEKTLDLAVAGKITKEHFFAIAVPKAQKIWKLSATGGN